MQNLNSIRNLLKRAILVDFIANYRSEVPQYILYITSVIIISFISMVRAHEAVILYRISAACNCKLQKLPRTSEILALYMTQPFRGQANGPSSSWQAKLTP